tara:strand:- start:2504 stop:2692 length:189 start_codon:yes stop_codon:yes gene_type:complete
MEIPRSFNSLPWLLPRSNASWFVFISLASGNSMKFSNGFEQPSKSTVIRNGINVLDWNSSID